MDDNDCPDAVASDHLTREECKSSPGCKSHSPSSGGISQDIAALSIASAGGTKKVTSELEISWGKSSTDARSWSVPNKEIKSTTSAGDRFPCGNYDADIFYELQQSTDGSESEDSDEDSSDDYDSDASQDSFESRKNSYWFRAFFEALDTLPVEQITKSSRRWHCPACKGGPGAIAWFRGLQPLLTHATTKGPKRGKLHRDFAELLEEEIQRKGIRVISSGDIFGKWKGLPETKIADEVVWPPMVMVMNTVLEQDENDKWIGMGSQELLDYFKTYGPIRARHSYGPQGHRGISVLIFHASAAGYSEAELLHKHFAAEGTGREAWEHHRVLFCPGGKRQLYGFLASKEDVDIFNRHSNGKSLLKFEMRSFQEVVVDPVKQMREDNRQFLLLKYKVAELERMKRSLEEFQAMSEKVFHNVEGARIAEEGTMEHKQSNEVIDQVEVEQQKNIVDKAVHWEGISAKHLLQDKLAMVEQDGVEHGTENHGTREDEGSSFLDSKLKAVETLQMVKGRLLRLHEEKKAQLMRCYLGEKDRLDRELDSELTELAEKRAAHTVHPTRSS